MELPPEEERQHRLLVRATEPEFADKFQATLLCAQDLAEYTGDGSVDFRGFPILKRNTGNWRACSLILVAVAALVEIKRLQVARAEDLVHQKYFILCL
nr:unnamed protein product [Digitaria exilis]